MDKPGKQLAQVLSERPVSWGNVELRTKEGELTKDVKQKVENFQNYYKELHSSSEVDKKTHLFSDKIELWQLSEDHMDILEAPNTLDEIKEVIGYLKSNTASDPDRFTVEIVLCEFTSALAWRINACIKDSSLPATWLHK